MDNTLDFLIPADNGVKLVLLSGLGQVAAILAEGWGILFFLGCIAVSASGHVAIHAAIGLRAKLKEQFFPRLIEVHAQLAEDVCGHAVALPQDSEPEMLHADVALAQAAGFHDALFEQFFCPRC